LVGNAIIFELFSKHFYLHTAKHPRNGYNTIPNRIKTLHTYKKIHTAPDIEKKHKPCAKKHKAYILKYKALILK